MGKMKDSFFMNDSSDGDYGKEAMLDYQLSWLMRVAANEGYKKEKPKLYAIAKETLLRLLKMEGEENVDITEVEVWKQWCNIDLVAQVKLKKNGQEEKHVIAFEDKAYTQLREGQLEKCKYNVEKWYKNNDEWKDAERHFCVVAAYEKGDSKAEPIKKECEDKQFEFFGFYEVIGYTKDEYKNKFETESDLFNEFWSRHWV